MTLKGYIWGLRIMICLSLIAIGMVLVYIDPESSGVMGIAFFFLVAFFALGAIFNLGLLYLRRKFLGEELAAESVGLSFRQGILFAVIVLGIAFLQSRDILVWWDALLVVAGAFLVELFFLFRS